MPAKIKIGGSVPPLRHQRRTVVRKFDLKINNLLVPVHDPTVEIFGFVKTIVVKRAAHIKKHGAFGIDSVLSANLRQDIRQAVFALIAGFPQAVFLNLFVL